MNMVSPLRTVTTGAAVLVNAQWPQVQNIQNPEGDMLLLIKG
jgi:hypothetical protein